MINKKIESFTLIEILVVIVVIGILSSFILVGMSSMSTNANVAKVQVWANGLRNAGLASIVSEYKFQGTTSDGSPALAIDAVDSWGSNPGIVAVTPPNVETSNCALGRCVEFAGGANFIRIADSTSLVMGSKMSAFVWVKGADQDDKGIFAHYDETSTQRSWAIATSGASASKLRVALSGDGNTTVVYKSYVSSETILDSKWHYVGFTYTGNTLNVYIDGRAATIPSPVNTGTMTGLHNSTSSASIGSFTNVAALVKGFTGSIDDAIIFSEAISMTEVQRNYFSGLNSLLAKGAITNDEYNERISLLNDSLGSK